MIAYAPCGIKAPCCRIFSARTSSGAVGDGCATAREATAILFGLLSSLVFSGSSRQLRHQLTHQRLGLGDCRSLMPRRVWPHRTVRWSHRSCVAFGCVCPRASGERDNGESAERNARAREGFEICHVISLGFQSTIGNPCASEDRHTNRPLTVIKKKTGASFDAPVSLSVLLCLTISSRDRCDRQLLTPRRPQTHGTSDGCCRRSAEEQPHPWCSGLSRYSSCPGTTSQRRC